MRKSPSLVRRLWLASLVILPIAIGFSSYALNRAYVRGLDSAEYEALLSQIYALLAIAEPSESGLSMPEVMANPRFETPDSGLYARIVDSDGTAIWRSNSLLMSLLEFETVVLPEAGSVREHWLKKQKTAFRSLSFTTVWELAGEDRRFTFQILHSQQEKQKEINRYRRSLLVWLSGMAFILLALQVIITLWGLRPLKFLAQEIGKIERGESQSLPENYPIEIEPVTTSVNKLLHSESKQRERYKNSLSDLAHSLKTPLSVIRSQLADNEQGRIVDEQVERMSTIINHQLRRASAEVQTVYGPLTSVRPLVERLIGALQKVYANKGIHVSNQTPDNLAVAVSEDDCFEVLGNIIENAFKYGEHKITVTAQIDDDSVKITIADDGPGIDSKLSESILQRGARADTSQSGQGIGLAIAVDILSSYNGALTIARSNDGGAAFHIIVPN